MIFAEKRSFFFFTVVYESKQEEKKKQNRDISKLTHFALEIRNRERTSAPVFIVLAENTNFSCLMKFVMDLDEKSLKEDSENMTMKRLFEKAEKLILYKTACSI